MQMHFQMFPNPYSAFGGLQISVKIEYRRGEKNERGEKMMRIGALFSAEGDFRKEIYPLIQTAVMTFLRRAQFQNCKRQH